MKKAKPPDPPHIDCEQHHTCLPVSDVRATAHFYTKKLGFKLEFTSEEPPTMAGVSLDKAQIFLEQGTPNPKGCSIYFVIGNADELYDFQRANGVEIVAPPEDRPYGLRITGFEICTGTNFNSAIAYTTPAPLSGLNEWISQCAWRSASSLSSMIWPRTSA